MLYRTEGIILKSFPYGESDLIVTILTSERGVTNAFAKSPRKIKSRFGSALEPFSYDRISLWGREDKELPRLTQADIIHPFQVLRNNINIFMKVLELIEITLNLIPVREPNREVFFLLLDTMKKLENEGISNRRYLFYKIRLLGLAGLSPRLKGCSRCERRSNSFYLHEGTIICEDCTGTLGVQVAEGGKSYHGSGKYTFKSRISISQGALNLYEKIRTWEWSKLNRIVPSQNLIDELEEVINLHVQYRTDRGVKTRDFIDTLKEHRTLSL